MRGEWVRLTLKEAGVSLLDCVHKTPPDAGDGYPYIAIPQMKEGRIDFNANPRLISAADLEEWTKKANPQEDDVVLSRRCNPGETAYVPAGVRFALGQNLVLLRSDSSRVYPPFLRWLANGPEWWAQVDKYLNVGAVFDSLRCADIPNFELPIPPIEEQKAIAHILGSLDDKIELNRRMNATLEAMARALFKSWFVDFDPVIDNALAAGNPIPEPLQARAKARKALGDQRKPLPEAIQKQFPSRFVSTEEMGWVPEGWEVSQISQLCTKIQNGGTPRKDKTEYWDDGTVPWLTSGEVRQNIITNTVNRITNLGLKNSSAKWLPSGATVIAMYGATAGQVAFVGEPLTTNQAVCGLIPKEPYRFFNYLTLERIVATLANQARGSAQQNISKGIIQQTKVVIPPVVLGELLEKQVDNIFDKWIKNLNSQETLAKIRDTLLPKLISGQLRIPDAEKLVADAI
ncbi:restriction endonuclease subunit S [Desulfurivibrio alkaliphilus]|uniref:Restriction modification system DNA specificity domain protein n=1 Tax=Desulfurivibrio alkaliphilus (strain DSM 19089 / UNIQEM U267 / AHT2) TaxID=589865 RepID=D6Z2C9_DESAT|nr:restriction endonuclease subunit S [Desulfurivibrio alkaliphilus]ADH85704.1 restriction modification system DNA specificity domain protein [Desulfurivibrio alkaliphilus AHT 2]